MENLTTQDNNATAGNFQLSTVVDILSDSRISWSGKSIVTYLMALPVGETTTVPTLQRTLRMSHATAHAAVQTLLNLNLVTKQLDNNSKSLTKATIHFSLNPTFELFLQKNPDIQVDFADISDLAIDSSPSLPEDPEDSANLRRLSDHIEESNSIFGDEDL